MPFTHCRFVPFDGPATGKKLDGIVDAALKASRDSGCRVVLPLERRLKKAAL